MNAKREINCFDCNQRSIESNGHNQCLNHQDTDSQQHVIKHTGSKIKNTNFITESFIEQLLSKVEINYHGEENINLKLIEIISEIDSIIKTFHNDLNKIQTKINDHCNHLRKQFEYKNNRVADSESENENESKNMIEQYCNLNHINSYEQRCSKNLKNERSQMLEIKAIFIKSAEKLVFWKNFIHNIELSSKEKVNLFNSVKEMKNMLINSGKFFNSLIFTGQLLVYEEGKLKYNEFSYNDILNTDRLNANFKTGKIIYATLAFTPNYQTLATMWMSLIRVDKIIICLQVFNQLTNINEVIIKYFNNNGQLIGENLENRNCEIMSMTTSEQHIAFAIEYFNKNDNFGKKYALKLYDLDLCLTSTVSIDYQPLMIHKTCSHIYILTNTAPFVHVHDWNLNEKFTFGQDLNQNEAYFMPNATQIFVRNEKLYIRDHDNIFIKVLDLYKGHLIKIININLLDCLLHIDSIGRIIVINQDCKILYIFNEYGQIQLEYDLTFIQDISSFCVTDNGHLLINDSDKKILHII